MSNLVHNVTSPANNPTGGTNDTRYLIDDAGNFVTNRVINGATTNMTTFVVNAVNQYTSVNGTNHTWSAGDLIADGVWTYTYDCEDRLIQASKSGVTVDYLYDAFGRMIRRNSTVGGVKDRRYYYDGWQIVEERDGVNNAENRYIYGTGINEVVKYIKADSANRFFTYDGLGSMTEVTGGDGNLQESYTYEVYGTVTMRNAGGNIITATGNKNRLHFTGYELDPDTGLYLARNRWYHPRLGRFMQPDPIGLAGGDLNLYRYCGNNPVNRTDPYGEEFFTFSAIAIGIGVAVYKTVKWGIGLYEAQTALKNIEIENYNQEIALRNERIDFEAFRRSRMISQCYVQDAAKGLLETPGSSFKGPVVKPGPSIAGQPVLRTPVLGHDPTSRPTPIYYPTREVPVPEAAQ
jgi:RHS repeat-associated protein